MARYIDADKLLKNWCESICKQKPNCSDDCFVYSEITNAPTADVRENVRGEWTRVIDKFGINGEPVWKCSACKKMTLCKGDFCPNCGADMRRRSDDNE